MSQYSVLAARLGNELNVLDQVVSAAQSQVEKGQNTGDKDFYQAAALSLQNYYMGIERIFVGEKIGLCRTGLLRSGICVVCAGSIRFLK